MGIPTPPEKGGDAEQELPYRLRQQQLTADYGLFALKTHDIDALLQEATRVCALGLQSEFCKVLEHLPEEGQFLVRAGVGWKPGVVGHARIGDDLESPAGYAFKTGEPVIANHLERECRFRTPRLLAEHGVKRALNVLIQGDKERYGVLEVDTSFSGRFTEVDLTFMQNFANLAGVAIERQKVEEALRHQEALAQQATVHQQLLTREISHRVKNSLSIIASLLAMQSRMASDVELQKALGDARARVQTIAQVHDRLWRTSEVHQVDLGEFMNELCEQFRAAGGEHTLICDVDPVTIATDRAVSLGLLANELVTNAFKYAYDGAAGEVRLSIKPLQDDLLRFEVVDHGVGMPADFDARSSRSLGMKLVKSLGAQLGGEIAWQDANPGTRFFLDFPRRTTSTDHGEMD